MQLCGMSFATAVGLVATASGFAADGRVRGPSQYCHVPTKLPLTVRVLCFAFLFVMLQYHHPNPMYTTFPATGLRT